MEAARGDENKLDDVQGEGGNGEVQSTIVTGNHGEGRDKKKSLSVTDDDIEVNVEGQNPQNPGVKENEGKTGDEQESYIPAVDEDETENRIGGAEDIDSLVEKSDTNELECSVDDMQKQSSEEGSEKQYNEEGAEKGIKEGGAEKMSNENGVEKSSNDDSAEMTCNDGTAEMGKRTIERG